MPSLKLSTTQRYSLFIAFSVVIVFLIVYKLMLNFILHDDINWTFFSIINLTLFVISFLISKLILDKFIYDKIKLIYKTIHDLKTPKSQRKAKMFKEKDVIKQANQEVLQWTREKRNEIEELKKLEAYKREFLGNISHELKPPILNIQKNILSLTEDNINDPSVYQKQLQHTKKSVNRIVSIIEDLEVISHLESGELKLEFSDFDIVELTEEVISLVEPKAKKKNVEIFFAKNYDKPIYVYASREQMKQLFLNLINNSIKYSYEDGKCKISFFDMDKNILVEISDKGKGIPKKELPRIYERFYRGDRDPSKDLEDDDGTGLGLSIVKHIIEAHNQTINVRSVPEIGTTFAFTLKKGKI